MASVSATFRRFYDTELTSVAVLSRCWRTGTEWHYIAPGKPMQNGLIENFNGS